MVTFLRRDAKRFLKFGKGKGKKATYRRPKGRDNKMREKKRGYPPIVSIGYRSDKKLRGVLNLKESVTILNVGDLNRISNEQICLLGRVGEKKKTEIIIKANEMKLEFSNVNVCTFIKKLEKKAKIKNKKNETKKPVTKKMDNKNDN